MWLFENPVSAVGICWTCLTTDWVLLLLLITLYLVFSHYLMLILYCSLTSYWCFCSSRHPLFHSNTYHLIWFGSETQSLRQRRQRRDGDGTSFRQFSPPQTLKSHVWNTENECLHSLPVCQGVVTALQTPNPDTFSSLYFFLLLRRYGNWDRRVLLQLIA